MTTLDALEAHDALDVPSARRAARDGVTLAAIVLATRVALLLLLGRLVHGHEFTDDVGMLARMAAHPFRQLLGDTTIDGQHPPLLGLMEAILAAPAGGVASQFYAMRLAFIAFEALTAYLTWQLLVRLESDARARFWKGVALVVLPMGWMTSTVMAQDETIAGAAVALVLILWVSGRERAALLACGAGIVAAKVFLAVPLAALVLAPPSGMKAWIRRAAIGASIPATVYAWVAIAAHARGNPLPLAGFKPSADFGVTIWTLENVGPAIAGPASEALTALACVALIVAARARGRAGAASVVALVAAMLGWVLAVFYHVNPEYYFFAMPPLLVLARSRIEWAALVLFASTPWTVNFFYGVRNAMAPGVTPTGGKAVFVRLYQAVFSVDPQVMFRLSMMACIASTVAVAILAAMRATRPEPDARA